MMLFTTPEQWYDLVAQYKLGVGAHGVVGECRLSRRVTYSPQMLASSTSCYSQPRAVHEDAADTPADQVLEGIGHSKEDN
eukprot:Em0009g3a